MFHLENFISEYVTKRKTSMFLQDIDNNNHYLQEEIEGKSFLVLGGAGSIGSSFIKAILPYRPSSLVIVDINENGLAELTRDIRSTPNLYVPHDYIPYPMNFTDESFHKMFKSRKGFDIVANFSAHKHVRSEKDIFSIQALLQNNVLNAYNLLQLLKDYPPKHFFCVSTDKAANPINIMGASKKIMEEIIFSYSNYFPVKTARFANVAFSNGSLPESFFNRINKCQPISAPKDIKRYFVSPMESGQICMLACLLAHNTEIFFPKLRSNQMMSFSEIARKLLVQMGYSVLECQSEQEALELSTKIDDNSTKYPVYFSHSDTTGEKEYEEFYTGKEEIDFRRFKSLGVIKNNPIRSHTEIKNFIQSLRQIFDYTVIRKTDVIRIVKDFIPNFEHKEKNKFLDGKM